MTALANVQELRAYMSNIRLTDGALSVVQGIIDGTQGELEMWLGYPLIGEPVTDEAVYVIDARTRILGTSQWPVASVESITDTSGNAVSYQWDDAGNLLVSDSIFDVGGYTMSFTPGLPPQPRAAAKNLILRVASREVTNKHDDTRSDRDTFGRPIAPVPEGWQKGEKRQFSRFRRRSTGIYSRQRYAGPTLLPAADGFTGANPEQLSGMGLVIGE